MGHSKWSWVLVAGGALVLWGCDDRSSSSSTPPAGNTPDVVDAVDNHAEGDEHDHAAEAVDAGEAAKAEAESQASALMEKAQPMLDQALAYLEENKFDLADKALVQLEGMDGLPTSFMDKIKDARSLIDAKKKADQVEGTGEALQGLMGK